MKQDQPYFACSKLDTWELARTLLIQLGQWVFRGHADSTWRLEPTIERLCRDLLFYTDAELDPAKLEDYFRVKFTRFAHELISSPPQPERTLEWLSIMQHHGSPTRLLDVTFSPYVAAFFAFESARPERDVAIWAINQPALGIAAVGSNKQLQDACGDSMTWRERLYEESRRCIKDGDRVAAVVEPTRMNPRLMIQQAAFLAPLSPSGTLEENLFGMLGLSRTAVDEAMVPRPPEKVHRLAVLKLILPGSLREEVLKDLKRMNVTWATLFPGLDGYARELYYELVHSPRPIWVDKQDPMPKILAAVSAGSPPKVASPADSIINEGPKVTNK